MQGPRLLIYPVFLVLCFEHYPAALCKQCQQIYPQHLSTGRANHGLCTKGCIWKFPFLQNYSQGIIYHSTGLKCRLVQPYPSTVAGVIFKKVSTVFVCHIPAILSRDSLYPGKKQEINVDMVAKSKLESLEKAPHCGKLI